MKSSNVLMIKIFLFTLYSMTTWKISFAQSNNNTSDNGSVQECKDQLPDFYCKMLKSNAACESRVFDMMELCPATCQYCKIHCRDFLPKLCAWWQHHLACFTHPKTMGRFCRKSCRKCSSSAPPKKPPCHFSPFGCCWDKTKVGKDGSCPECKDNYEFCPQFRVDCLYGVNKDYLHRNCPKTCGICDPRRKKWSSI